MKTGPSFLIPGFLLVIGGERKVNKKTNQQLGYFTNKHNRPTRTNTKFMRKVQNKPLIIMNISEELMIVRSTSENSENELVISTYACA